MMTPLPLFAFPFTILTKNLNTSSKQSICAFLLGWLMLRAEFIRHANKHRHTQSVSNANRKFCPRSKQRQTTMRQRRRAHHRGDAQSACAENCTKEMPGCCFGLLRLLVGFVSINTQM